MIKLNKVFASFWLFGLINNVLYVVILSAAVDLVGPLTPKATVLIADVLPSFMVKLTAPFYIHLIPYTVRIWLLVLLSTFGMLVISLADKVAFIIFGIVLASLSSGLGELTFLQLTHYFTGDHALSGFSSGTGGAGLVGSFAFLVMTTWIGMSVRVSLFTFCILPLMFLVDYFYLLPYNTFDGLLVVGGSGVGNSTSATRINKRRSSSVNNISDIDLESSSDSLLGTGSSSRVSTASTMETELPLHKIDLKEFIASGKLKAHVVETCHRLRPYVLAYMVPLSTVYIAEYIINQGVSPTLLFDLDDMPFSHYRDAYVTYGTLYQLGVFISRSSGSFIRVRNLYAPAILQCLNLMICIWQSMYMIIPNIYILFILIFYEGLLGGLSYVNTFMLVSEKSLLEEREFAMGAVGISDSAGIVVAATISMYLEPYLCQFQVDSGRPWCRSQ